MDVLSLNQPTNEPEAVAMTALRQLNSLPGLGPQMVKFRQVIVLLSEDGQIGIAGGQPRAEAPSAGEALFDTAKALLLAIEFVLRAEPQVLKPLLEVMVRDLQRLSGADRE